MKLAIILFILYAISLDRDKEVIMNFDYEKLAILLTIFLLGVIFFSMKGVM